MDIKQLMYFVAVAEEGSITAAARRLYMSQPPITAQIKQLEEELHCVLFLRGARTIRLTDAGKLLYDRAKTMLDLQQSTREEIAECISAGTGTLRLGVVSSVAGTLLPDWLGEFHARHPNIRFELYEENTYQLLEKLRAGIVEAALVRTPFPAERFTCVDISTENLVAAGRADLFAHQGEMVSLEALSYMPLLIYRRWEHIVRKMFADRGFSPNFVCKNDSAATTVRLMEQGLGVGLLPQSGARQIHDERICVKRLSDCGVETTITAVYRSYGVLSPSAQAFMDFMNDVVQWMEA